MIKKASVLRHKISISEVDLNNFDNGQLGVVTTSKGQVALSKHMTKELKETALLHELIHYGDNLLAIGLKEEQVTQLGLLFSSIIRENKQFIKEVISD